MDYSAALRRHYRKGPPATWQEQESHVPAHATAHPWRILPDLCALSPYRDTLEMAGNFGMPIASAADRIGGLRARVEFGPLCDRGLRRRDPGVVSICTRDEQPEPHHRHPGTGPVIGKLRLFMSWFNASGRCYRRLRRRGGGQSPR
ncbi:putative zinc-binding metallopeptidase [Bradyrhizobium sp. RDI18]|uniref:putative zinc-binding metallopeptidase n=1 Tax=Bradyrhizobium sp. RDI18 TaxID=3367400 RepID=UPI00371C70D0